MTTEELRQAAQQIGFSHSGAVCTEHLTFLPDVRAMCAADRCNSYGTCWTCPPHCGTLEEITAQASRYHRGILVQSTGEMEDDFDVECMVDTEQRHKAHFRTLIAQVKEHWPNCLPMAAGRCTLCRICTCPTAPCRFPDQAVPSMEAYGLLVSDVCQKAGLPYYYGPHTITYTSCILLD